MSSADVLKLVFWMIDVVLDVIEDIEWYFGRLGVSVAIERGCLVGHCEDLTLFSVRVNERDVSSDGVLKLEFWMIEVVKDMIEDI